MRNIMEKDVSFIKEFTSKLNLFGINAEQVIFLMESCGNIHRLGEQDIDDLNAAEYKRHQDFLQEEEYNAYYHRLDNPEPDEVHTCPFKLARGYADTMCSCDEFETQCCKNRI